MLKIKNKSIQRIIYATFMAILMVASVPVFSYASSITSRKVVIGSSVASVNTTYDFTFSVPSSDNVKSISFQACDTAIGVCTQTGSASGFSSSTPGATLSSQPTNLGSGGSWVINNSNPSSLRISNASNAGSPSANASVSFSNVHNPSASNSTFFIRITTYSDTNWTAEIDSGVVATSTAGTVMVTANVNETLTFTLASSTVALGTITSGVTASGTSTFAVATNASTGYSVTYSGDSLTSGSNVIDAMTTRASSNLGSKQFGINLRNNSTPSVGSDISGGGLGGAVAADYNVANEFKFTPSGEEIASSNIPSNANNFTVSYIANIDDVTPAGQYSTAINFVAVANF